AARCLHDNGPIRPAALYTFGSPRVGDAVFADSLKSLTHSRIVDELDIVPEVPPVLNIPPFRHTGTLHHILEADTPKTSFPENVDALLKLRNELKRLQEGKFDVEAPKFLADHAPINYTARLEAENS